VCATFPSSATNTSQPSPSILCVDDSEEMLLICRTVLETAGYQVFTASGGEGVLEFLQFASGQCSVLDYVMPGMSGTELASGSNACPPMCWW
jgi:CheY-like chemotaxis protein